MTVYQVSVAAPKPSIVFFFFPLSSFRLWSSVPVMFLYLCCLALVVFIRHALRDDRHGCYGDNYWEVVGECKLPV